MTSRNSIINNRILLLIITPLKPFLNVFKSKLEFNAVSF